MLMALHTSWDDEYNIDFEDTRKFTAVRWEEMTKRIADSLPPGDLKKIHQPRTWVDIERDMSENIGLRTKNRRQNQSLLQIRSISRSLGTACDQFCQDVLPHQIDLSLVWDLILLLFELSSNSQETANDQMSYTSLWLTKLQGCVPRFSRVYEICEFKNESTIVFVDMMEKVLLVMCDNLKQIHRTTVDPNVDDALKEMNDLNLEDISQSIKHLEHICTFNKVNENMKVENLQSRHFQEFSRIEKAAFPLAILPFARNQKFYGREKELKSIDHFLGHSRNNPSLRTFTLYGRRGVGKTEIAFEYACRNPSNFDAVFWISCDTAINIRQSFNEMGMKLQLPGVDRTSPFAENLILVQKWLKSTKKNWLMIFDYADKEEMLERYLPPDARGAILITSRYYYNFLKDPNRKGETIQPFQPKESLDFLLHLLNWPDADIRDLILSSETEAAKELLERLFGLPLSIAAAAGLISMSRSTEEPTIAKIYSSFLWHNENLPPRHHSCRTLVFQALDAILDMAFSRLSGNARSVLGVLEMVSPDHIPIDLFLPRNKAALNGKLEFIKHDECSTNDEKVQLNNVAVLRPRLLQALEELQAANFIRWDGQVIAVHREIQEAMNYDSCQDLQDSFNSAVNLVHEAFPKEKPGGTLFVEWNMCETYITHAVHISRKFVDYQRIDSEFKIQPPREFFELLTNVSRYLYEVGEYETSRTIIDIARTAVGNTDPTIVSRLCNTRGSNYYDMNSMVKCRQYLEQALQIREQIQTDDNLGDVALTLNNLGNLETATKNYDKALGFYDRAVRIYLDMGEEAESQLGITYLGIGRCHLQCRRFETARQMIQQAERLFIRGGGKNTLFMAFCHYAYGSVNAEEELYIQAKRFFELSLAIAAQEIPAHPFTVSVYYSLGCCEFSLLNAEQALFLLNKALAIAQFRSTTHDDGTVPRILWKIAIILKDNNIRSSSRGYKSDEGSEDAPKSPYEVRHRSRHASSIPLVLEPNTPRHLQLPKAPRLGRFPEIPPERLEGLSSSSSSSSSSSLSHRATKSTTAVPSTSQTDEPVANNRGYYKFWADKTLRRRFDPPRI